jgi:hypothetical protein
MRDLCRALFAGVREPAIARPGGELLLNLKGIGANVSDFPGRGNASECYAVVLLAEQSAGYFD